MQIRQALLGYFKSKNRVAHENDIQINIEDARNYSAMTRLVNFIIQM